MAKNKSATEPKRSLIDQVLGSIDADAADLLRGYVALPLVSEELLAEQVDAYLVQLDEFTSDGEIVDMELALDIARWCIRMLEEIGDETPDDAARLIQAAVRYFVNFDDSDSDVESLIGLDDDAEVVEAVAVATGLAHVLEAVD